MSLGLPSSLVPMQPELAPEPFHRPGSVYEEKYDGWRMLAYKDGARVRLVSVPRDEAASVDPAR
jgi:ATP-dependent DNA ligase